MQYVGLSSQEINIIIRIGPGVAGWLSVKDNVIEWDIAGHGTSDTIAQWHSTINKVIMRVH